ncbi:ParB/RepB/Spo0J family partition protein [Paraburkholderia acidiphila]|uniref:Chromosome partitioning protein ParB n=1 Tax=Paraburkholderia acidiphila TaxID=2571747 RepID=A0A7Z2G4J6_9BURK|nr:plasmid partitioning protein RepB C-terminal domain-containing protein [Paraburkholderia acidiphila]QGZ55093.1 chromosome partitioning protein ParB [Paraburkholderia acidiphila]
MDTKTPRTIEMVPVDKIRILNPRSRSKRHQDAIVENIATVGLKKPITVSCRTSGGSVSYELVCGQGRLEAVRSLGYSTIPAQVVERNEADCLLMSLVENVARRNHSTKELLHDILDLRNQGYKDNEIATKVGLHIAYVESLLFLMERGEERLLNAVDSGTIPIAIAISIARSDDKEVQAALMDAYSDGSLKGKQLAIVRRLLDHRRLKGERAVHTHGAKGKSAGRSMSPEALRRMYLRESARHKMLAKKIALTHARLAFIVQAMREMMKDDGFVTLLTREGLTTLPRVLEQRVSGEKLSWTS